MNDLFKLRGSLSSQQNIILTIIGIIILLGLWSLLAHVKSEVRVTQIDQENLKIEDRMYYDNDSILFDNEIALTLKTDTELLKYGLKKKRVYAVLPSPLSVLKSFKELHTQDFLIINSLQSVKLNLLGYIVAIGISIPLGFALGLIPLFRGLFSRIFDSFRFIPLTAVTGIFVVWLGLGNEMKVSFLAFGIIVYLVPVVVQRIDEVKDVYLKTVFTLGATDWQTIKSVYFPAVISKLSDDIRVLTAISWTYITIAEMLNRSGGIGELIWIARRQSRIDKAFAVLIVIVLIGIVQDRIFLWMDRTFFSYKYMARNTHK
ncbi:MAG: NitT/TauT family transport system permease protein [Cognaticolwellia sp.]|jgi:NitT/TauT family transport system permease protein